VAEWSFDVDTVTFDAEVPTWDAGLFAGVARLHLSDSTFLPLRLANVAVEGFSYDRSMFRSPYGTVWHQEGDKRRLVESITLRAYLVDGLQITADITTVTADTTSLTADTVGDSISDSAGPASALVVALPNVVRVESSLRIWDVVALGPAVRQPVESGYRFDITWAYTTVY
jgi:hypothetical protein